MASLVVGSFTVSVAVSQVPRSYEDVATYRRRWDGAMDVEVRGAFGRARTWRYTTAPLTTANAASLVALLIAAGTVELSGDSVGGSAQTCYARNTEQRRVAVSGADRVVVSGELAGVDG